MINDRLQIKQLIWHDINTIEAAKTARLPALVISTLGTFFWAVITIVTALGHKSTDGYWVFLYLPIFALISYGLYKMSREAAIAYFVVSIVNVMFTWGYTIKLLSAVAGVFVALLAIRGIFSYSRLRIENEQTAASNQRSDHDRA